MSEQLRHKMTDFEVVPPPAAWEAIAARLHDDKQYAAVSSKMNDFEAAPPPQTWNNVVTALEEKTKNEIPVINIRRNRYRMAAAAILVGLFIGGWMMMHKNAVTTEVVKNSSTPVQPAVIPNNKENGSGKDSPADQIKHAVVIQNNHPALHPVKNNHSFLPVDDSKENTHKYAVVNSLPVSHKTIVSAPPALDKNGVPIEDIEVLTSSNYLVVAGPNGQLTRISSKFANVIRFMNDSGNDTEEYLDKVIKESSTWKKRFQEWRNKISRSAYLPSPVNFLDIAELKDLIQEKQ